MPSRLTPILLALPLVLATGAPAAAAPTWTIVSSPNPDGTLNYLSGVFARTASDAWAVGTFGEVVEHDEDGGLILHWDGTSWTRVPGPNPQFLNESLTAVGGVAANDVWAVGGIAMAVNQPPRLPWALHWNGTAWTEVPIPTGPNPGGTGRGGLRGVAALAAGNVWTVGRSRAGTALVEHWDGTAWTVTTTPTVSAGLDGVAAVSPTNIWAVGDAVTNPDGTHAALIMHYDGTSWQRVANPVSLPAAFTGTALTSVSAVNATDIWAVGATTDQLGLAQPLIEHWNGTAWSRVANPPRPAGISHYALGGVAALTATDAYAVGGLSHEDLSGGDAYLVHWNGTAWSRVTIPHTAAPNDGLAAIATTPGGGPIWAVGSSSAPGQCCGISVVTTLVLRGL